MAFVKNFRLLPNRKKAVVKDKLVERCLKGDSRAQYELYEKYAKAMFNTCLRIVGQTDEAEDVLQETFVKAFNNLHTYNASATFGAWLKRIAVNTAINHVKRRKINFLSIENQSISENEIEELPQNEAEIDFEIQRVKKAIKQLPDGFRAVFSLYLLEGYDHSEIAEILEISVSTSKSQYSRAKRKLVQILETI